MQRLTGLFTLSVLLGGLSLTAQATELQRGREAILKQAGCFIVDYSFTEIESLKDGYKVDDRVYDSNDDKTTYELIIPVQKSNTEIRLQHVLFVKDLKTGEIKGMLKHHSEDWEFEASNIYNFVAPGQWEVGSPSEGNWVRKTTNLDDGLRYQCEGQWDFSKYHPEFSCSMFAPIPGREIRDMSRKDYNTLDRSSRVISYDNSWIERQTNIKTILDIESGVKTSLAKEHARIWYVKQNAAECAEAKQWAQSKITFWTVLMETWEEYFSEGINWSEKGKIDGLPRFVAMYAVENKYSDLLKSQPELVDDAKTEIRSVIELYKTNRFER